MAAQPAVAQGQPVLHNNSPPVATDANDHGPLEPNRNDPARAATAIDSTASPNADAVGANGASIRSKSWASTVNHERIASALEAKRRSQPRTVDAGTPKDNAERR